MTSAVPEVESAVMSSRASRGNVAGETGCSEPIKGYVRQKDSPFLTKGAVVWCCRSYLTAFATGKPFFR